MEISEIVQAQTLTIGQLKAIRDKVVVDKMVLRRAVLSLYPNFNVNDPVNMQELETDLRNTYPEMDAALKSAANRLRVNSRATQIEQLRQENNIPLDVMNVLIDFTKIPPSVAAFDEFKTRALEIFNFQLETERLRRVVLVMDKRLV